MVENPIMSRFCQLRDVGGECLCFNVCRKLAIVLRCEDEILELGPWKSCCVISKRETVLDIVRGCERAAEDVEVEFSPLVAAAEGDVEALQTLPACGWAS